MRYALIAAAALMCLAGAARAQDIPTPAQEVNPCPVQRTGDMTKDFTSCPAVAATGHGDAFPTYTPPPTTASTTPNTTKQ